MKRLACVLGLLVITAASDVASAQPVMPPAPVPEGGPVALFHCVRYKDTHHIAPCAVPKVVEIVDPCWRPDPCNPCCKPPCVLVEICVPKPMCCDPCNACCDRGPKVCCSKDGRKVRYDYGKYAVDLCSRNGVVTVDYDD